MLPVRFDPMRELSTLQREMDDLFKRIFGSRRETGEGGSSEERQRVRQVCAVVAAGGERWKTRRGFCLQTVRNEVRDGRRCGHVLQGHRLIRSWETIMPGTETKTIKQYCSVCKDHFDMEVVKQGSGKGVIWLKCPGCQGFLPYHADRSQP